MLQHLLLFLVALNYRCRCRRCGCRRNWWDIRWGHELFSPSYSDSNWSRLMSLSLYVCIVGIVCCGWIDASRPHLFIDIARGLNITHFVTAKPSLFHQGSYCYSNSRKKQIRSRIWRSYIATASTSAMLTVLRLRLAVAASGWSKRHSTMDRDAFLSAVVACVAWQRLQGARPNTEADSATADRGSENRKKVSFMSEALKNMNVLRKSRKVTYLQYLNFEHLFIKICFKLQDSIAVFSPPHPA